MEREQSEFPLGARVRILEPEYVHEKVPDWPDKPYGAVGVVVDIGNCPKGPYQVEFDDGVIMRFTSAELERIDMW